MNKYKIILTNTFKNEFKEILEYVNSSLGEPGIAKRMSKNIINAIFSLKYFPSRFIKLKKCKVQNLHRLNYNNYVIIYFIDEFIHRVYILHIFHGSQDYLNKL